MKAEPLEAKKQRLKLLKVELADCLQNLVAKQQEIANLESEIENFGDSTAEITKPPSPKQKELEAKLRELAELEAELTEKELELATLEGKMQAFHREYMRVVGLKYAELDSLNADIARYETFLKPKDRKARKNAEEAWQRARQSQQEAQETVDSQASSKFEPSESLKQSYRKLVKLFHPDKVTDPTEKERLHKLMVEINQAYEAGDEDRLREILAKGYEGEQISDDVELQLKRTIQKIDQIKVRLEKIAEQISEILQSQLYELYDVVNDRKQQEVDLLAEMAKQVDLDIANASAVLSELKQKVGFNL